MWFRWVLVLCSLAVASSDIVSANGVLADPCNAANPQTCTVATTASTVGNVILLPSPNSPSFAAFTGPNAARTITFLGSDIPTGVLQVCLANAGAGCENAGDINIATCVDVAAAPRTANQVQIQVPVTPAANSWVNQVNNRMELETTPRALCFRDGALALSYTGLRIGVAWNCDDSVAAQTCATAYRNALNAAPYNDPSQFNLSPLEIRQLQGNTVCCKQGNGFQVGECINPKVQTCCGGAALQRTTQKCCNAATSAVVAINANCPCQTVDTANNFVPNGGCPTGERCCVKDKYPELVFLGRAQLQRVRQNGLCFDPLRQRCCNTGELYDPGTDQCCVINGIQSLNLPCPCEVDAHCEGASTTGYSPISNTADSPNRGRRLNHICCKQLLPQAREVTNCDIYCNYPGGQGLPEVQRCTGVCIDPSYQMCCNGAVCRREFEKCCNSTCCNRRIGTCADYAYRAASPRNPANYIDYNVRYTQCTTIEQLCPIRVFWIFVLPTILGLGTLAALAVVLVFTSRARRRVFVFVEKLLIIFSLFVILYAMVLYFSPLYKYGIILALASMLAILTAAAGRVKWLNILAVVAILVALWYLFDPFSGNGYLNSSYLRRRNFFPHEETDGLYRTIGYFYEEGDVAETDPDSPMRSCVDFYNGYFAYDEQLRDEDRRDNPFAQTFGYCSRGYLAALMYFGIIAAALLVGMLILALIMLILRFRKEHYDVIELTTQIHDDSAMPFPGALDDDYFD